MKFKFQCPKIKVLLEVSHNYLCILYGYFYGRVEYFLGRHYLLQSPKYLLSSPLQKKCAALSVLLEGVCVQHHGQHHVISTVVGRTVPHWEQSYRGKSLAHRCQSISQGHTESHGFCPISFWASMGGLVGGQGACLWFVPTQPPSSLPSGFCISLPLSVQGTEWGWPLIPDAMCRHCPRFVQLGYILSPASVNQQHSATTMWTKLNH